MAGCIIWRCRTCHRNASERFCDHPAAAYSVVYYVSGRPRWKRVGRDKKDALAVLSKINSELVMGTYFDLKPIRFKELAERFLTTYGQVAYKPTSREYYRFRVKALLPAFGDLYLTDITREKISQYAADQLTKEKVSPATINKNIGTLKRVLTLAVDWGYLPKNPAQGIKSLREEHKERDFLTPEEIRLLLKHADEPYRTLFMTAVLTGMRRGEVLGLQWGDIDWNSNVIQVRHNLSYFQGKDGRRTWRLASPKSTKSIRTIPMPQELREALEMHRLSAPVSPHDLVFCYKDGEPLHPDWIIKSEFNPALARAGLRRIRFHDLRHTYAAILITHAVNIKVIQTLLGHVSIDTTLDTYGHLLPGAANEVGAKLSDVVFGQSPTEKQPIPG